MIFQEKIRDNLVEEIKFMDIFIGAEIESTNDFAKKIVDSAKTPFLVVAESQSRGRGRLGRSFFSPKGGIYITISIGFNDRDNLNLVTPAVALAVRRAIKNITDINLEIKWVNDLYFKGKKVGGILVENCQNIRSNPENILIVGIGLNTFKEKIPEGLEDIAISLGEYLKEISIEGIIGTITTEVYMMLSQPFEKEKIIEEYSKASILRNQIIKLYKIEGNGNSGEVLGEGEFLGFSMDGSIKIKDSFGVIKEFRNGEVTIGSSYIQL